MNTKMFNLVFNPLGTRNREYYNLSLKFILRLDTKWLGNRFSLGN